jgi:RNA-directed DNA polymerase
MDPSSLAAGTNPVTRGWISYSGVFYRSKLRFLAWRISEHIVRWAMKKYKRFRRHPARALTWLVRVRQHHPALFAHWQLAPPLRGRPVGAG